MILQNNTMCAVNRYSVSIHCLWLLVGKLLLSFSRLSIGGEGGAGSDWLGDEWYYTVVGW
jgi:hypothetical protein